MTQRLTILIVLTRLLAAGLCCGVLILAAAYLYLNPRIPDAESYRHVTLRTPLRIYSADGKLIQEFGERLQPITFDEIPPDFINALLDTEDKRFFSHEGIDLITLVNASVQLVLNTGTIRSGASTITMQLARNISLGREVRFIRKFKEMLLALKIERQLTKQEILTLYLNVIPFGKHAFGVQAAAQVYYGKDINELSLPQLAMLAGIPKAPESGNPVNGPERALDRRNLVLRRMLGQDSITRDQYDAAIKAPITASVHSRSIELPALYISELVREQLLTKYGNRVYSAGFEVFTTVDSGMQQAAEASLSSNLEAYDRRHGYRRPEKRQIQGTDQYQAAPEYGFPANWIRTLDNTQVITRHHPAIVIGVEDQAITVLTKSGDKEVISWPGLVWARPFLTINSRGPEPKKASQIVSVGDLVRIKRDEDGAWELSQVPDIEGALVAVDPSQGAIRALVGGYDFLSNQFNHATQARRQPGSNFKPFFYAGALEGGLTAASIYNDAPLVLPGGEQEEVYRPTNAGDSFRGDLTLREALYRSVNLISLRVLLDYGADRAIDYVKRFGFDTSGFPRDVQLALGGGTIALTPLDIATGYAVFANGGYQVQPHLIERIELLNGEPIFQADPETVCADCDPDAMPGNPARRVVEERVAFIMNSMLKDVINRGTGSRAKKALKRNDLHGKTGTTNDADIWFSGFTRDLVATTWVGFDNNGPVGNSEFGSTAPLSMWTDFMKEVLPEEDTPEPPQPNGLVSVRINPKTGLRTGADDRNAIFELFREELVPPVGNEHVIGQEDDAGGTQVIF